jgi:hypothetical protein
VKRERNVILSRARSIDSRHPAANLAHATDDYDPPRQRSAVLLSTQSFATEQRHYNDGKAWLCKLAHKKKTVCWVSIWDKFFKTIFYFTAKNDRDIEALPIASDVRVGSRLGSSSSADE